MSRVDHLQKAAQIVVLLIIVAFMLYMMGAANCSHEHDPSPRTSELHPRTAKDELLWGPWVAVERPGFLFFFHMSHKFFYTYDGIAHQDVGDWHFEDDYLAFRRGVGEEGEKDPNTYMTKYTFSDDGSTLTLTNDALDLGILKLRRLKLPSSDQPSTR